MKSTKIILYMMFLVCGTAIVPNVHAIAFTGVHNITPPPQSQNKLPRHELQSLKYQIGVYYYPGWKGKEVAAHPWERIQTYPERKPLLGWYKEGADDMKQQLAWMNHYGISFIAFDWYFSSAGVKMDHALNAYLQTPNKQNVNFALLWANHTAYPQSINDWDTMIHFWIDNYFKRNEYLTIDGQPVVYIFSIAYLDKNAKKCGLTVNELIARAQTIAKNAHLPGIYFVGGTGASNSLMSSMKNMGYSAYSAYNYHQGPTEVTQAHSYTELDQGYREHWKRFADKGNLSLIVPLSSGWDRRPWGGSKDPLHDNCLSTPQEFRQHLVAAKQYMDAHPMPNNRKMAVICAWNEFGEGSFIEPATLYRFAYLEQIRSVFGTQF